LQSINEDKREEKRLLTKERQSQSPIYSFMYALKSSETRRQYPKRLKMLYDYLGLAGSLDTLKGNNQRSPIKESLRNIGLML
jgi:hypothetical protein